MATNNNEGFSQRQLEQLQEFYNNGSGPSSRRSDRYGNNSSSNSLNSAWNTAKASFEQQKAEALAIYEEIDKLYKEHLDDIEKMNISSAEKDKKRAEETARYSIQITSTNIETEEKLKSIARKKADAERQHLRDTNLGEHLSNMKYTQDELKATIHALDIEAQKENLTAAQRAKIEAAKADADAELRKSQQTELTLMENLRKEDAKRGTNLEKWAQFQKDGVDRLKEQAQLEQDYNDKMAENQAKSDSGQISPEEKMLLDQEAEAKLQQGKKRLEAQFGATEFKKDPLTGKITNKGEVMRSAASEAMGKAGLEKDQGLGRTMNSLFKGMDAIQNIGKIISQLKNKNPFGLIVSILTGLIKTINKISKSIDKGIEQYENIQKEYLTKVNTRLDNGDLNNARNFDNIATGFNAIFGSSRYFSQTSLLGKLNELVSKGVVFNVEQRAILADLAEKMSATFDMVDDHLLNLTKLQQADMSVAQLGAESLLTEFFNNTFEDNSYMSQMYDQVTSTIMDTLSTMNAQDAVAFNYNVNKWLGSLYSLGMSTGGIGKLAEGINALGTGDNSYFSGNDAARVLFASASGGAFADALVNGLDASNIDTLLGNIVNYLAEISTDTNNVTKQVKAGIFGGLSYSDIRSVANLAVSDIEAIKNSQATWETTKEHFENYLLDFAQQNTTLALQISNMVENTQYALGQSFMQNDVAYTAYKVGQTMDNWLGDLIMGISKAAMTGSTIKTLINNLSGAVSDIPSLLRQASNFSTGEVTGGWLFDLIGKLIGDPRGAFVKQSYWDLGDTALINGRGQAFTGKVGLTKGLSSSTSISFGPTVIPLTDSNGNTIYSPIATSTGAIGNYNDTGTTASLYSQSTTIQTGLNEVENGAGSVRDINDLYAELFENQQHPIRVSLAKVEDEAQGNLTNRTYNVSDSGTHTRLNQTLRVVYL